MVNTINKITIWQQNVNKSPSCQHDLLGNNQLNKMGINIIALQEPAVNFVDRTIASKDWFPIYPSTYSLTPGKTRSLLLINTSISLDSWEQIDVPSGDITAARIRGPENNLLIFNVYNDGDSNVSLNALTAANRATASPPSRSRMPHAERTHTIWLGDFNRHHPIWDNPNDMHLFTDEAMMAAQKLIEAIADTGLELALPAGLPTHIHNVTKCWMRLDHMFISDHSLDTVISYNTRPEYRGIKTDHLPIVTELNLETAATKDVLMYNFREVDWEDFRKSLSMRLSKLPHATTITSQGQLDEACKDLTAVIQRTIHGKVPIVEICSKSKQWWTKELTGLHKCTNKLGRLTYKNRGNPTHSVHAEHKAAVRVYSNTLKSMKKQHWRDWLKRAEDLDI